MIRSNTCINIFSGRFGGWRSRASAAHDELKGLAATFGEAHDFSQSGSRVYFSLPTTWTGLTHGKHFEEHGSWSFVLDQETAGWRIVGYGWGVSAYSETPLKP